MASRSVHVWQPIRVLGIVFLGTLLAACSLGRSLTTTRNAEQEPAPLRKPQWSVRLSGTDSPIVARATDDAVVVVSDQTLTVFNRRDGSRRWSRSADAYAYRLGHRVITTSDSVIDLGNSSVVVYHLADGEERLRWKYDSPYVAEVGVLASGLLTRSCEHSEKCTVALLDFRTGKPAWQRQFGDVRRLLSPAPRDVTPGSGGPGVPDLVDPLLAPDDSEAVVVTDGATAESPDAPDRATRLDVRNGATLGSFAVPDDLEDSSDGAFLVDGVILHGEDPCGQFRAYDARTGAARWSHTVNQQHIDLTKVGIKVGNVSLACESRPPVVDRGLLVSTPQHQPQIMDLATGEPRWTAKSEGVWLGYDAGIAMAWTDPGGPYHAIDTRTDKRLWTHRPPWLQDHDPQDAGMALAAYAVGFGQFFYSGVEDNGSYQRRSVVRVLDLRTGNPLWAATGDNRLIGVGTDWVATASVPGLGDPAEVRLFKR